MNSLLIIVFTDTLSEIPGLFTINRFYPTILFSVESPDTIFKERDENKQLSKIHEWNVISIGITFFNTSAVKDITSLCTCIALLDNIFKKDANVTSEEKWTEQNISWKKPENIDQ